MRTPAPFTSSAGPDDATGEPAAALAAYDQALRLYRAAGDRGNEAATLSNIGAVYGGLGERQRALEYFGQALPILREVGDRAGEAITLNNIGHVYDGLGEPQRALEYFGQALPIRREVGDRAGEATTLNNIGARVPRSGRAAAGAGVLRAGAADPAGGRRPGRGGGHAEQHRRRVPTVWASRSGRWSTTGRRCRSGGRSATGPGRRSR